MSNIAAFQDFVDNTGMNVSDAWVEFERLRLARLRSGIVYPVSGVSGPPGIEDPPGEDPDQRLRHLRAMTDRFVTDRVCRYCEHLVALSKRQCGNCGAKT